MTEERKHLLTPEQMTMWRRKHHGDSPELNADNRKRFNRKLRQQLEAMAPWELSATQKSMQADWDALPADKRTKVQGRISVKAQNTADKLAGEDEG